MSTSSVNNKSQQLNARFPHEVVSGIEASLQPGETKANFIVTAVRGEIARRQAEGSGENPGFFARCTGAGGKNRSQSSRGDRATRHRRA